MVHLLKTGIKFDCSSFANCVASYVYGIDCENYYSTLNFKDDTTNFYHETVKDTLNFSNLKKGQILLYTNSNGDNHTVIYVGEYEGEQMIVHMHNDGKVGRQQVDLEAIDDFYRDSYFTATKSNGGRYENIEILTPKF